MIRVLCGHENSQIASKTLQKFCNSRLSQLKKNRSQHRSIKRLIISFTLRTESYTLVPTPANSATLSQTNSVKYISLNLDRNLTTKKEGAHKK